MLVDELDAAYALIGDMPFAGEGCQVAVSRHASKKPLHQYLVSSWARDGVLRHA